MKPDWDSEPEWAKYILQHPNGIWEYSSKMPKSCDDGWDYRGNHAIVGLEGYGSENPEWKNTLEKRPMVKK